MEIEVSAEAKDKRLNRWVAITVVVLSVFSALCNIKDGNIVQAMQQAQASSIDQWNEYQATRTKLHIDEATRAQLQVVGDPAKSGPAIADLDKAIAKYSGETPQLAASAKAQSAQYDALNVHDDQFDAADAALTTAISVAAVAALAETEWLLWLGWVFGAFGIVMGMSGFLGLGLHSDFLARMLS